MRLSGSVCDDLERCEYAIEILDKRANYLAAIGDARTERVRAALAKVERLQRRLERLLWARVAGHGILGALRIRWHLYHCLWTILAIGAYSADQVPDFSSLLEP